jgi:hypothetical protein
MRVLIFLALLIVFAPTGVQAEGSRFFTELADIPVMPGLFELVDETMIFDKAEGRVVESAAASETKNSNEIKAFYNQTLPQMGWVRVREGVFQRGAEQLHLTIETRGNLRILRLSLTPVGP